MLLAKHKQAIKHHEQELEELGAIVTDMKYTGQDMNKEVKVQSALLGNLNVQMDNT